MGKRERIYSSEHEANSFRLQQLSKGGKRGDVYSTQPETTLNKKGRVKTAT